MTAHAYEQSQKVRIFDGTVIIADLPLREITDDGADAALGRIGMKRVSEWEVTSFGREAGVRFDWGSNESE